MAVSSGGRFYQEERSCSHRTWLVYTSPLDRSARWRRANATTMQEDWHGGKSTPPDEQDILYSAVGPPGRVAGRIRQDLLHFQDAYRGQRRPDDAPAPPLGGNLEFGVCARRASRHAG